MKPPPLIMVPGLLCTGALFRDQHAALGADLAIEVADISSGDSVEAMASAILDSAPARFSLAGLSMGGYVCLAVMRIAPQRVDRLVLMDTSARPDTAEQTANRHRMVALAREAGLPPVVDELASKLLGPMNVWDAALRARLLEMACETGVDRFAGQQQAILSRPDARSGLSAIEAPTLVIVGSEDAITPLAVAREMADAIPGARLEIVTDAGHLTSMERPQAVNALLRRHLVFSS